MRHSFGILVLFFLFSCRDTFQQKQLSNEFKIPFLVQQLSNDTLLDFEPKNISYSFFRVSKKTFPCDTLNISTDGYQDTSISDFLNRNLNDTLLSNISYDGFEIVPDYNSSVYKDVFGGKKLFAHYPIYVINNTKGDKYFPGKDQNAFGIQEALDSSGIWRPIEGRGFDFCGNGYWNLKILPNQFLVVLATKYKGTFHTKMRVRIKIGNMIYISKSFDGTINYEQFYLEKGDSYFTRSFQEDKTATIQDIFYGAIPLQVDKKNVVNHAVYAQQPK